MTGLSAYELRQIERRYEDPDWKEAANTAALMVRTGDAVLDYGSSTGEFLQLIANRPHVRLFGIEVSSDLRTQARARLPGAYFLPPVYMAEVPMIDLLFCWNALNHQPDPRATLQTLVHKMRPFAKGVLVVRSSVYHKLAEARTRLLKTVGSPLQHWTPEGFKALAQSVGLEVREVKPTGPYLFGIHESLLITVRKV